MVPGTQGDPRPGWALGCACAVRAVVVMVSVEVTAAPLGVTDAGEKLQLAPAGNPAQARVTALAKLF